MGIECSADGGDTSLILRRNGNEQRVTCGGREWVKGRMFFRGTSEQTVAACGAWTADDTFAAKVCFRETPHCVTLRLKFSGEQLVLDSEMNVDFGPTRQPQLTGRVTP